MTKTNTATKELLNDRIAKKLFKNEKIGKAFSSRIISKALNLPYDKVFNNIKLYSEEIAFSALTVDSKADAIYSSNYAYINLEINFHYTDSKPKQLLSYVYQLYLGQIHTYEDYNNIKKVIQISIDSYDVFKQNKFMYKVYLMEEKSHIIASDALEIIHINLDFLRHLDYNEVMKEKDSLMKDLYFLICGKENIDDVSLKVDDLMKKVIKEAKEIAGYEKMHLFLTDEEMYELDKKAHIAEGVKQEKKKIATKMLSENLDISLISKITGLSINQIEELK